MNAQSHRRFRTLSVGILTAILLAAVPLFWIVGSAQRGGAAAGLAQDTPPEALRFQYMGPPSAAASRRSSGSRATRRPTTPARRPAASGRPPTAARRSSRSSTTSRCRPSARSPCRRSNPNIVWAGTGEAWAIRDADVHGRRHLQVHRRRRDLDEHGPARDRPHRPHHRPPDEPGHRLRVRARPRDRAAGRTRRLPHDGRRRDLAARALRQSRTPACSGLAMDANEPRHPDRRHVGSRDAHVGHVQRRPRQRHLHRRRTAARPGRRSCTPACRSRRSARSTWRSRRRTRSGCSRSSRRRTRDRSGDRTTRAMSWKVVSWDRR